MANYNKDELTEEERTSGSINTVIRILARIGFIFCNLMIVLTILINDAKYYKDLREDCKITTGYITELRPVDTRKSISSIYWHLIGYYYDSNGERKEFESLDTMITADLKSFYGLELDKNVIKVNEEPDKVNKYIVTQSVTTTIGYNDKVYYCTEIDEINSQIPMELFLPLILLFGLYFAHAVCLRQPKMLEKDVKISIVANGTALVYKIIEYLLW